MNNNNVQQDPYSHVFVTIVNPLPDNPHVLELIFSNAKGKLSNLDIVNDTEDFCKMVMVTVYIDADREMLLTLCPDTDYFDPEFPEFEKVGEYKWKILSRHVTNHWRHVLPSDQTLDDEDDHIVRTMSRTIKCSMALLKNNTDMFAASCGQVLDNYVRNQQDAPYGSLTEKLQMEMNLWRRNTRGGANTKYFRKS